MWKKESDSAIKITEKTKWVINTSESQKFEIKTENIAKVFNRVGGTY